MFFETCDKVRMIFDQMLQLRKTGSKKNQAKVKKTFSKVKKLKPK
jgi:hypothetical protein